MSQPSSSLADVVLVGGRVIDPETETDAILNVAISGSEISYVGSDLPESNQTIDCQGRVVSPGFIDLHSHAQSMTGHRLQALDGVTTALDLEAGDINIAARYRAMATQGRPINFGYSASWSLARTVVLGSPTFDPTAFGTSFAAMQFADSTFDNGRPASPREVSAILDVLDQTLDDGAIGIGMLLGYIPDTDPVEYQAVAALAAQRSVGTFTHTRTANRHHAPTAHDSVVEVVRAAQSTGAAMHVCHINSTSDRWMNAIIETLESARAEGLGVTSEAYPYNRGCTTIGAPFLSLDGLRAEGREPDSLIYVPTGESIADGDRLNQLRERDPSGIVMTLSYDETVPEEAALMDRAMALPMAAFASDSIPLSIPGGQLAPDDVWPPSAEWFAHPRSAGCFSKVLRWLVRDRGLLTVTEAVRRCSLLPAQIAEASAPAMSRKGRIQSGMDADVIVFDLDHVADQATYTQTEPSIGFHQVFVGGMAVVRDGELDVDALPGRSIRGRA